STVYPCDATSTYTEDNSLITSYTTQPYSQCQSVCPCTGSTNLTNEEIQRIINEIKEELIIDIEGLSSFRRKKSSVPDDRPLSKGLGYAAIIVLVMIGSIIILSDLHSCIAQRQ
ncbi:hypothetical protein FSP39_016390, partial [Pinctada imbricata]